MSLFGDLPEYSRDTTSRIWELLGGIRAAGINLKSWAETRDILAVKTATTVYNTDTMTEDPDLRATLTAGLWRWRAWVLAQSGTSNVDIQMTLGGARTSWSGGVLGLSNTATDRTSATMRSDGAVSAVNYALITGIVAGSNPVASIASGIVNATGGPVHTSFARAVTGGFQITIMAGSWIEFRRVG